MNLIIPYILTSDPEIGMPRGIYYLQLAPSKFRPRLVSGKTFTMDSVDEMPDRHSLSRKVPKSSARSELGVTLFYLGVLLAIVVALLADGLLRAISLAVLGLFGLYFLVGDFFLAIADERASKQFPHDNYHSDVGRIVTVLDDFVLESGTGRGKVLLAGECWKARTADGKAYKAGAELKVLRVEGLVLVVAPCETATIECARSR